MGKDCLNDLCLSKRSELIDVVRMPEIGIWTIIVVVKDSGHSYLVEQIVLVIALVWLIRPCINSSYCSHRNLSIRSFESHDSSPSVYTTNTALILNSYY